ncbi:MAG: TetR family transcriptional regulator [Clostridia bacterium]|nr:TetR family transcriptional regulator [Clostridia bacterium]
MQRTTVKEIMAASFRELARERPVDKTIVKEITANCDYSQTTFYRQFKDKYDCRCFRDAIRSLSPSWRRFTKTRCPGHCGPISWKNERICLSVLILRTFGSIEA